MAEVKRIIEQAQEGSPNALDALIKVMLDNKNIQAINRYLYINRLLSPSDARQEFWLGVIKAIPLVKTTIGDPLQFLTYSGVNQVKTALRNVIGKRVFYVCRECGYQGRLRKGEDNQYRCSKCQSTDIDTWERERASSDMLGQTIDIAVSVRVRVREDIDMAEFITELKQSLTNREAEVLDMILQGNDRDSSTNYLEDIGIKLDITPQCVNQYLRKIRQRISGLLSARGER